MKKNRALCLCLVILFGVLLPGCNALFPQPTPTPTVTLTPTMTLTPTATATPTATPLPRSTDPECLTLVTLEEEGTELWFGETGIPFDARLSYFYTRVTREGGFSEVIEGELIDMTIQGQPVALASNLISGQSIITEPFGPVKLVFTEGRCPLLVVTSEQLTMIYAWLP
jgi:hypothetical protein